MPAETQLVPRWRCIASLSVAGLIVTTAVVHARAYGGLLIHLFEPLFLFIYERLDLFSLELVQRQSEWGYLLTADNSGPIRIGDHWLQPGLAITSFTLLANSLQHLLFYVPVVAGGACYFRCNYPRLLLLSVPCLLLLEIVDIPFVLIGNIEAGLLLNLDPALRENSLLVQWAGMLANGGRMGLSMLAAWCVVLLSRRPEIYKGGNCVANTGP